MTRGYGRASYATTHARSSRSASRLARPAAPRRSAATGGVAQRRRSACLDAVTPRGAGCTPSAACPASARPSSPDGKNVYVGTFDAGDTSPYTVATRPTARLTRLPATQGCVERSLRGRGRRCTGRRHSDRSSCVQPRRQAVYVAAASARRLDRRFDRATRPARIAQLDAAGRAASQHQRGRATAARAAATAHRSPSTSRTDGKTCTPSHQASAHHDVRPRARPRRAHADRDGDGGLCRERRPDGCAATVARSAASPRSSTVSPRRAAPLRRVPPTRPAIGSSIRDSVTGELTQKHRHAGCISVDGAAARHGRVRRHGSRPRGPLAMDLRAAASVYVAGSAAIVVYEPRGDTGTLTPVDGVRDRRRVRRRAPDAVGGVEPSRGEFSPDGSGRSRRSAARRARRAAAGVRAAQRATARSASARPRSAARRSDGAADPDARRAAPHCNGDLGGYGHVAGTPTSALLYAAEVNGVGRRRSSVTSRRSCSNRRSACGHNTPLASAFQLLGPERRRAHATRSRADRSAG